MSVLSVQNNWVGKALRMAGKGLGTEKQAPPPVYLWCGSVE